MDPDAAIRNLLDTIEMDPNAAIKDLLDALETNDIEEAAEMAIGLRAWLKGEGFVPNAELLDARRLFLLLCKAVLDLEHALKYPEQD